MLRSQRGEAGDEPGPVERGEGEADGDEEADEEFGVVGVDAVGEDIETDAERGDDDEDLGPRGERLGAGGLGGAEAVAEALPGGGRGPVERLVAGETECGDGGDEGTDAADPGAGLQVDDAAEVVGDGTDGVAGGAEGAEGQEADGAVGAAGGEPAQAPDAVPGQREQQGECGADEGEDLEAAGVAGDGEVAGELVGPGPGEEGAGQCDGGADEGADAGRGRGIGRNAGPGAVVWLVVIRITPDPRRVRRAVPGDGAAGR